MTAVHGVVVARNDWGPLAVAITHALSLVDCVHVLDHGSTDQTASGLAVLAEHFGDRMRIYRAQPSTPFDQKLLTNALIAFAEADGADWVYVFDSDEFLIHPSAQSLKEDLRAFDTEVLAARYPVSKFISLRHFDRTNLEHYRELRFRALPQLHDISPDVGWEYLYGGDGTFFDLPSNSKIIMRTRSGSIITQGAHHLYLHPRGGRIVDLDGFECAHVTLIARDMLERKSANGRAHRERGLPRSFGWHNQLINQLDVEGRLDWFWGRHSLDPTTGEVSGPNHETVDSLVESLDPSLRILATIFGSEGLGKYRGEPVRAGQGPDVPITFEDALTVGGFFDDRINRILRARSDSR